MSNWNTTIARLRMPASESLGGRVLGVVTTCAATAHMAAVSSYKPFADARNGAQGGANAWSPPV